MLTDEQLKRVAEGIANKKIPPQYFSYYADKIAKIRRELHYGQPSSKPTKISEQMGLIGEFYFSRKTGLVGDFTRRKFGDHYDFLDPNVGPLDVKTSYRPEYYSNIYVEPRKLNPKKIYIRAKYDNGNIEFLCWEYGENIKQNGVLDKHFKTYQEISYKLPVSKARPMSELYEKLGVLDNNGLLTF